MFLHDWTQVICLWQEYHRSDAVFFSSHPRSWDGFLACSIIDDVQVTLLRWYLSGFFSVKLLFPLFAINKLWRGIWNYINIPFLSKLSVNIFIYIIIDLCFPILFNGLQSISIFNLIFKLSLIWQVAAHHTDFCVSLTHPHCSLSSMFVSWEVVCVCVCLAMRLTGS